MTLRRFRSIRARLTFWNAAVLAAILLAYASGVYLFLRHSLYTELDRQLHDDFESAEERLQRTADGGIRADGTRHHDGEDGPSERWLEVWSIEGDLLYREGPEGLELASPAQDDRVAMMAGAETVATGPDALVRVRSAAHSIGEAPVLIRVARSETRLRHELGEFLAGIGFGMPVALLLAYAGGYYLAGRALKPVGEMAACARTITAEHLEERLPIENPDDELGQLGTVFNETLARLERSFEALSRFTADAAHELRTPLTALRSVGEVALHEPPGETPGREVIGSMLEEADRLTRLVETLLTLSRADGGRFEVKPQRLSLMPFAQEMVEYLSVLADEKGQRIEVEGDDRACTWADPLLLRQAVLNVLDNAIKHGPEGSRIRLVVGEHSAHAIVDVIDQGPGIEAEHLPQIFDRFYRIDRARSRRTGGAGLGLSIAQWATRVNGGTIEVECRAGAGTRFRFRLPLAGSIAAAGAREGNGKGKRT